MAPLRSSAPWILIPSLLIGCSATGSKWLGGSGGSGGSDSASSASSSASSSSAATTGNATAASSAATTSGSGDVGGGGGAGGSGSGGAGGGGVDLDGGPGDSGPPVNAEVYAHSAENLYKLHPITKQVSVVGPFLGCDAMIDIALNKNGQMYGTSFGGLYKIDKLTAACTLIVAGNFPNSLSFVPAGTVDPVEEALVGYAGTTYLRINTNNGNITTIGDLGSAGYISSGDIVSIIGGSSYLTVNGNGCDDCLVEVDAKTGALVNMIGPLNHSAVYGLAYWGGVAYGFDEMGNLFEINVQSAATMNIPFLNVPPNLYFWGAGSTTAAPLHL